MHEKFRELFVFIARWLIDVLEVGAANPAVWACSALFFLKDWYRYWHADVFAIWAISFSNYLCLNAISFKVYGENAKAAFAALEQCSEGYNISSGDTTEYKLSDVTDVQSAIWNVKVLFLRPKAGFEPFLTFKAFLVSSSEHFCPSIILANSFDRSGPAQKFFILHEICHASALGRAMHLNRHAVALRLSMTYIPLMCIAGNGWIANIVLAVLSVLQGNREGDLRYLEIETDRLAWNAFKNIHGTRNQIESSHVLEAIFRTKADLGLRIEENLDRAEVARLAREPQNGDSHERKRSRRVHSINSLGAFSYRAGSIGVMIACFFSPSDKPPLALLAFCILAMWASLVISSFYKRALNANCAKLNRFLHYV